MQKQPLNLSAGAGRWSADDWQKAFFGSLAIAALVLLVRPSFVPSNATPRP
jgi:hypothetical protein